MWSRPRSRVAVVVLTALFLSPSLFYLRHAWWPFPKAGSIESAYPYQISKWVHDNLPQQRVLPIGEVRFWFDAWFDNTQTDGGSEQGMENQMIRTVTWAAEVGSDGAVATRWLQASGTDAIIVAEKDSREFYNEGFHHPEALHGLPVLFDDGQGTTIRQVPRVHQTIGRVVDKAALAAAGGDTKQYVSVIENPDQPLTAVTWKGFDEVTVSATTAPHQSVLLQETYDPGWHAYEQGREIPVRQEPVMDFMLLDVGPGAHAITMRFETPLENRAGAGISVISLIAVLALISSAWRAAEFRPRPSPASSVPAPSQG